MVPLGAMEEGGGNHQSSFFIIVFALQDWGDISSYRKISAKIGQKSPFDALWRGFGTLGAVNRGVACSQASPLCYTSVYSMKMRWHTKFQGQISNFKFQIFISRNIRDIAKKVI